MEEGATGAWAVEIEIAEAEQAAMDYAGPRVVGPHGSIVLRSDERTSVSIDVFADTASHARSQAVVLYQLMRDEAQLPPDADPTFGVVSIIDGDFHRADLFIFEAQDMLEQRRHELAVIAAQTHCEMWIARFIQDVAQARGLEALLHDRQTWTLRNEDTARIFEALMGVKPSAAPCWNEYGAHVKRRHACVHRGEKVSQKQAQASIDAAAEMVRFVETTAAAVLDAL